MERARKLRRISLLVALTGGPLALAGSPVVVVLAVAIVAVLLAFCWVLSDTRRTRRLVTVIQAVRGTTPPAKHR